ncbi:hypothetical protein AGABI2DRAFT_123138 [Agaricus bisporus var. bisporus H97]|uniref:hypothetical protein n=1 Tax=Agaricus bisporus var. bisporus (strain H97 / ATCC MYA-4626 / FGSC 10389) TaxID=936046 RepID=UPI00029F60D3|nr:hypothetical protein AGABI2DRAFT_123138 [Agaricus bisporus var. bisporus H97]EKV42019.1 hypothetical protein AGABI2DRAFT_123138 [Agaricus bisporus var. bisporus H97]
MSTERNDYDSLDEEHYERVARSTRRNQNRKNQKKRQPVDFRSYRDTRNPIDTESENENTIDTDDQNTRDNDNMSNDAAVTVSAPTDALKSLIPSPKDFGGNREQFAEWWMNMTLFLKYNKVTDTDQKIIATIVRLKGPIPSYFAEVWTEKLASSITYTWDSFEEEIKTSFGKGNEKDIAEERIKSLKQGNRNTMDFLVEFTVRTGDNEKDRSEDRNWNHLRRKWTTNGDRMEEIRMGQGWETQMSQMRKVRTHQEGLRREEDEFWREEELQVFQLWKIGTHCEELPNQQEWKD